MKLRTDIESYDIRNMRAILETVSDIKKRCQLLQNGVESLSHNIALAEASFDSENMQRAKAIMKRYKERLSDAQRELEQLLTSVREYSDKLQRAWREW